MPMAHGVNKWINLNMGIEMQVPLALLMTPNEVEKAGDHETKITSNIVSRHVKYLDAIVTS
jgi:hypothetical protein